MKLLSVLLLVFGLFQAPVPYPQRFSENGKTGYKDAKGKVLVAATYDFGGEFKEGFALVGKAGKRGFINISGKLIIACTYDDANSFAEGLAVVAKDGKYGFLNTSGQLVLPPAYERCTDFSEGFANVKLNGNYFVINTKGEKKAGPYQDLGKCSEGMIAVKKDGKWGYINSEMKQVIACSYDQTGHFKGGKAPVKIKLNYFFIDTKGQKVGEQQTPEDFKKYGLGGK